MRFDADHGHAILEGRKTTHRLPARRTAPHAQTPAEQAQAGLSIYQPNTDHPLTFPHIEHDSYGQPITNTDGTPRRTCSHRERIRVLTVTLQPLRDIDGNIAALRAEGFSTLEQFALAWLARHDHDPVMRAAAARRDLIEPVDTWRRRHADKPCWVLRLQVIRPDTTEYLAVQNGVRDAGSYTTRPDRALDPHAPIVDRQTLEDFARDNWRRFSESRHEKQLRDEANRLGREIRETTMRLGRRGKDVSEPLARIRRELDAMRRLDEAA